MSSMRFALAGLVACLAALPPAAANAGDAAAGRPNRPPAPRVTVRMATAPTLSGQARGTGRPLPRETAPGLQGGQARQRDHERPGRALSDADIGDLSAYFASQKVRLGTADPASVKLGERLYRGGNSASGVAACMSCHGPSARATRWRVSRPSRASKPPTLPRPCRTIAAERARTTRAP